MHKRQEDSDKAVLLTVEAAAELTSLGISTVRKRAQECGAGRKIGKSFRINKTILLEYLDSFEA